MSERIEPGNVRRVRQLQDRAARAIPAAVQEKRDGCWLRYGDSEATWWAGAVLMHDVHPGDDMALAIAAAESFYARHKAPARFQVCPACPPELDHELCLRGYERSGAVSLQVAATSVVARHLTACSRDVELREYPDAQWFDLLLAAQDVDTDRAAEWRLLQRVEGPSAYATALVDGRPVAVGRTVAETGWAGVFAMATLPQARLRGAGRAVLAALATWARSEGCANMYLQMTHDSTAALRLYRRAGFEEACTYHYRTASPVDHGVASLTSLR